MTPFAAMAGLVAQILEAPPPEYNAGPYTAKKVFSINPNRDCTTLIGSLEQSRKKFNACYVPLTDEIYLPKDCDETKGKIGKTCKGLVEHEEGHARGWRHKP